MTEKSRYWNGTVLGDATVAPYDADREFADVQASLAGVVHVYRGGVTNELNKLVVTGASSPLSIASGRAFVDGTWYENDAAASLTVPTPAASTRYDWVALEKDWATQTVRLVRVAGVEGAGVPPALTQTLGTKWQAPIYSYSVTTGGVITLADVRNFLFRPEAVNSPRCRISKTTEQVLEAGGLILILWDSEAYDIGAMHSTSSSTGRVLAPEPGGYGLEVNGTVNLGVTTLLDTIRAVIRKNGVATDLQSVDVWRSPSVGATQPNSREAPLSISWEGELQATDYLEMYLGCVTGAGVAVPVPASGLSIGPNAATHNMPTTFLTARRIW